MTISVCLKAEKGKVWSKLFFATLFLSVIFNAIDTGTAKTNLVDLDPDPVDMGPDPKYVEPKIAKYQS